MATQHFYQSISHSHHMSLLNGTFYSTYYGFVDIECMDKEEQLMHEQKELMEQFLPPSLLGLRSPGYQHFSTVTGVILRKTHSHKSLKVIKKSTVLIQPSRRHLLTEEHLNRMAGHGAISSHLENVCLKRLNIVFTLHMSCAFVIFLTYK